MKKILMQNLDLLLKEENNMTENQWWAIKNLLTEWYCEIYNKNKYSSVVRNTSEITDEIKKILDEYE